MPATHPERGSALLAALCFCVVLSICVSGYIVTAYRSLQVSDRESHQNRLNQLAEAGIEEALWELNVNKWSSTAWTPSGNDYSITLTGYTFDAGATGQVAVTVANTHTTTPTVTSVATLTLATGETVTRTLQATTAPMPIFYNALAALSTSSSRAVRLRKNGYIDSYDSSLGDYDSSTNRSDRAVLSGRTITVTDAQIYGYLTLPATSTVSKTASAKLYGSANAASPIWDSTRVSTRMFQPVVSVNDPSGTATALSDTPGSITLGTAGATTPELYTGTNLTLGTGVTLTIDGPVIIDLTGTLTTSGTATTGGRILVTTNGSLEIHLDGDLILSGRSIVNETLKPAKVAIFGSDTGNDTPTISTTSHTSANPLYAVIFMPSDALTVSGAPFHFRGSIVASTIDFSNTSSTTSNFPRISYDLDLRTTIFPNIETPQLINQLTVL